MWPSCNDLWPICWASSDICAASCCATFDEAARSPRGPIRCLHGQLVPCVCPDTSTSDCDPGLTCPGPSTASVGAPRRLPRRRRHCRRNAGRTPSRSPQVRPTHPAGHGSRRLHRSLRADMRPLPRLLSDFQAFITWLEGRREETVAQLDEAALEDFSDGVASGPGAYPSKARKLFAVTRLWLLSPYLPEQYRLIQPPWEKPDALDELLGPAGWSAENKTEPLHPQTMSPLLTWSL